MKQILFLILALTLLVISETYSQYCDDNCTNPPWTTGRIDVDIQTNCGLTIDYQYREIDCNGITYKQVKINWVAAVINESCGQLDFGPYLMEVAWHNLLTRPGAFSWGLPPANVCWDNLLAVGPACWEHYEREIGPAGPGVYHYPCNETAPLCCRHKRICCGADGTTISVNDVGYVPAQCFIGGPVTGFPCYSVCD